jgi:hypothetical protein
MGFLLVIGFIEHLQNVTTNNCNSLTELPTPKTTVTTTHIKSSQFAMSALAVAWWWIPTMCSASMLTFFPADDCLTTNSLLQLSCLQHLATDHTENTVPLLLFPIVALQTCLFAKLSLSNGCRTFAYITVVAQQRVYMPNCSLLKAIHPEWATGVPTFLLLWGLCSRRMCLVSYSLGLSLHGVYSQTAPSAPSLRQPVLSCSLIRCGPVQVYHHHPRSGVLLDTTSFIRVFKECILLCISTIYWALFSRQTQQYTN